MKNETIYKNYVKAYAYFIPFAITVLMLVFRQVRFSSVDDIFMLYIAESVKTNAHSEHLFYISVIFGYMLKLLYGLTTSINWFCIMEILGVNIAFISLYKIVEKYKYDALAVLLLITLQIFILNHITFTALGFLLPAVGVLWAISFVEKINKSSILNLLYSFFLIFSGFAFRCGSTLYCTIIMIIPILFFSWKRKNNTLPVVVALLVFCIVANYSVIGIEKSYNQARPEPALYIEFNEYRSAAFDRATPDYESNKTKLEAVGISENDLKMIPNMLYGDANVFTPEAMKTIVESRSFDETYELNPLTLINEFLTSDNPIRNMAMVLSVLALFALIFIKNRRLEVLCIYLFAMANIVFLFVRKRGLSRVYNPIAICGIIYLFYVFLQEKDYVWEKLKSSFSKKDVKKIVIIASVFIVISFSVLNMYQVERSSFNTGNIIEELKNDEENVYVANTFARNEIHDKRLSVFSKNFMDVPVLVTLGEWYIYSDYWNDYFKINNIEEYSKTPYLHLLKKNVLYVTELPSHAEMIQTFFKENYNIDVEYTKVKEMHDKNGFITVYVFDFNQAE